MNTELQSLFDNPLFSQWTGSGKVVTIYDDEGTFIVLVNQGKKNGEHTYDIFRFFSFGNLEVWNVSCDYEGCDTKEAMDNMTKYYTGQ